MGVHLDVAADDLKSLLLLIPAIQAKDIVRTRLISMELSTLGMRDATKRGKSGKKETRRFPDSMYGWKTHCRSSVRDSHRRR